MENLSVKQLPIKSILQFSKENREKGVYFGMWSFGDIVSSIKFTHREPLSFNLFKEDNELKKKYPEFDSDYYQRLINDDRTKKVIQFIIKEIKNFYDEKKETLITFPTSLILSLYLSDAESRDEYITELNEIDETSFFEGNLGVFLQKENMTIDLPNRNIMLVVDGQHRLAGLYSIYNAILDLEKLLDPQGLQLNKKLIDYAQKLILKLELDQANLAVLKELIENFQFSCTILLDYDIWEQGKVFADVNFNQKPVNKSLYYDIFGSYPDPEKNDIYLAHTWTVLLNSDENSALYKKIKLLGTGNGFFSQAFFVEALLPLLRKNGVWNSVVSNFIISENMNEAIPRFLNIYFNAIQELYPNYLPNTEEKPSAYKNILFKTTGLGALIKLIPNVFKRTEDVLYEKGDVLKDKIKSIFKKTLEERISVTDDKINSLKSDLKLLKPEVDAAKIQIVNKEVKDLSDEKEAIKTKISGEYYFSKDSKFAKGAGKGLRDKLYRELVIDLGL